MRRRRAWHVHKYWTRAPKIQVQVVKVAPVGRRPVIAGIAAKDRARLKTNDCFAALPVSSIRITGSNKRIGAVTGDSTHSPYRPTMIIRAGRGGPCRHAGRIIYRHAYQPTMINVAILHATISDIKDVTHD